LPNTWLAFTAKRGNTGFTIQALDSGSNVKTGVFTIPDGNYDISGMVSTIQSQLNGWATMTGIYFTVNYTRSTGIFTWTFLGTGAGSPTNPPVGPYTIHFNMNGNPINKANGVLGLGFYLGFSLPVYVVQAAEVPGKNVLRGNCAVNLRVDPYIMLALRDMNMVISKTTENYFDGFAKVPMKVPKGEHLYLDYQDLVGYEFTANSPIDLKILLVQLLDRNSDLIESCQDFSFTLEILEVTNLKLHEHYRNYTWLGQVPRVGPGARGSAVAGYLPLH
jgi:hypothetical protein